MVGSLVAPVWPPTGGGSAMGSADEQKAFLTQVRKACAIGRKLEDLGVRRYGVVRIDSAASPAEWAKDPAGNTKKIAETFQKAADIAESTGERLAMEGEICWGGMHSVKHTVELLEMVEPAEDRRLPGRHGAHAALHDGLQRAGGSHPARKASTGPIRRALDEALKKMTRRAARRGRSTSTSRRTTAPSRAPARTTRPAATACRSIPTASSTSSSTPATGCATTTGKLDRQFPAHLLGRLHVPQRRHDAAENLERRARRHGGGP